MRRIPSRELLWGSFHIAEDEREIKQHLQHLVEAVLSFINPEAYKKYKEKMNGQKDVTNDLFAEEVKRATGLSEVEYRKLLEKSDDEGIEFPEDPFYV